MIIHTNPTRTLRDIYNDLGVSLDNFTLDSLNATKANVNQASLKEIFLGWNNCIDGAFFGLFFFLILFLTI